MEFAHEQSGSVLIVKLDGRLDSATAQSAEEHLVRALPGERPLVAVDLSRLEYISSAGLRVLLVVAKKVQQAGGKLALFGLVPNVREIFSISGFDRILALHGDASSALAALR